jgi:integrase
VFDRREGVIHISTLPATDQEIRKLRLDTELIRWGIHPDATQIEYRDPKTPGLSLIVGTRAKTWSLTYATAAGRRRITLGRYPAVSLADARRSAEAKRVAARDGADHQQAKRDYNAARTVAAVAQDYLDKEVRLHSAFRNYAWVVRNDVIPTIGTMKMVDVRRRDIIRVVDRALGQGKLYMANRVLRTLQGLFKFAQSRGEIDENPTIGIRTQKERARDRALTDEELKQIWPALPALGFQPCAAIRLLLLTGQRENEVIGAKWSEIDFDRALWTLPAHEPGRSKKRKAAHLVPLSPAALAIFAELREKNASLPTVFRAKAKGADGTAKAPTRSMISVPKVALDKALPAVAHWRIHDLRRTCRTGIGMLGVPQHVAELAIGHALPGIVGVYDRHSYLAEKRDALHRWAEHVPRVVGEASAPGADIIALR